MSSRTSSGTANAGIEVERQAKGGAFWSGTIGDRDAGDAAPSTRVRGMAGVAARRRRARGTRPDRGRGERGREAGRARVRHSGVARSRSTAEDRAGGGQRIGRGRASSATPSRTRAGGSATASASPRAGASQPVTVVGIFDVRWRHSLGGRDRSPSPRARTFGAWFDREGQGHSDRVAGGRPACRPRGSRRAWRAVPARRPTRLDRCSGLQRRRRPRSGGGRRLPRRRRCSHIAGAALLVGAIMIFNTFSITVAQRAREFALMRRSAPRAAGERASRDLRGAPAQGRRVGRGDARRGRVRAVLDALFDAAGFGCPRRASCSRRARSSSRWPSASA